MTHSDWKKKSDSLSEVIESRIAKVGEYEEIRFTGQFDKAVVNDDFETQAKRRVGKIIQSFSGSDISLLPNMALRSNIVL